MKMSSACLLLALTATAGAVSPDDFAHQIDAIAQEALQRPTAAVSIAVARDGEIVFARAYGEADRSRHVAATPATVFHIDSISKNLEAAALLQLVDEGKLGLDDKVKKLLPEAPTHGADISVRQLLNHTSGIYSFTFLPNADANEQRNLNHEQVLDLFRDRPLDFEPGTSWRYSNSGFYLAGMLIERVTQRDYGSYLRDQFFQPMGLQSARFFSAEASTAGLALGYVVKEGKLVEAPAITWALPWAAGAVCATASDLVRWQLALERGRIVKPETLAEMRRPTVLRDGTRIDYGLGTRLGSRAGHPVFGHSGGGAGFTNVLESYPQDRLVIAVLTNTANERAPVLAAKIAGAALGLPATKPADLAVPPESWRR